MNFEERERTARPSTYVCLILKLMWDRHPWLTIGTAASGAIGGFTGIAIVDTINSAIHDAESRPHLMLLFLGLAVAGIIFRNASNLIPAYAAREISISLHAAICRKMLKTPLGEIERRGVPNVLTLVNEDIPKLMATLLLLPNILVDAITLVFGLAYLAYLSWELLFITAIAIPLGLLAYRAFLHHGMFFTRKLREEAIAFNSHSLGLLFGIKELQQNAHRRRWFRQTGFEFSSRRLARFEFLQKAWYTAGGNVDEIMYYAVLGIFIFGISGLITPEPATLTASILALMYVLGPVGSLVSTIPEVGQGVVACERLSDFGFPLTDKEIGTLLEDPPERQRRAPTQWTCLNLQDVRVCYEKGDLPQSDEGDFQEKRLDPTTGDPDDDACSLLNAESIIDAFQPLLDRRPPASALQRFELGPINLQIRPGELVFIVGCNGSGKSTLAKVLTGLYAPTEGRVVLDGVPVGAANQEHYRSLFTSVFTDFHLFDRVLGHDQQDKNLARARDYLVKLGLADKIRVERNRFSTTKALSNGQRKRLALICAYLEDRPIVVLDEWAADQDPAFKKLFYEVLLVELRRQGKCIIVITHDDHYFESADRVIRLKEGRQVSDEDSVRERYGTTDN